MARKSGVPPDVAWLLGFAALENAQRLLEASRHLFSAGHLGPALSLAISAREETAKVLYCMLNATGQSSAASMSKKMRSHHQKQAVGVAIAGALEALNGMSFGIDWANLPDTIDETVVRDIAHRVDQATVN